MSAPVRADSSDEEAAPSGNAARFDKHAIHAAVMQIRERSEELMPAAAVAEWDRWRDEQPTTLEEIPEERRLLRCEMPMKHARTAVVAVPPETVPKQVPLITYNNPADSAGYSKTSRARDVESARKLTESDVPIGSAVAVKRGDIVAGEPGGYGTLFYIADILAVHTEGGSAGEDELEGAAPRTVTKVTGHYWMPMKHGRCCDDEWRRWSMACVALHEYAPACEKRQTCKACREPGATTCKFVADIDAAMIFETKINFTRQGMLDKQSRERIATSAPEPHAWDARLRVR